MTAAERCMLCPRSCGANRAVGRGFCGCGYEMIVAKSMIHRFEEPPISGDTSVSRGFPDGNIGGEDLSRGSGTIFFGGCPLGCVYCQNRKISGGGIGKTVSADDLRAVCFALKAEGAYNINLVTPLHFATQIADALSPIKGKLALPIIVNTGGYDSIEQIDIISRVADVFLPDFKYINADLAAKYSRAADYPEVAERAIVRMYEHVGNPVFGSDGMLRRGVMVRHLVLPGGRQNGIGVVRKLREMFAPEQILLSLMAQYTPPDGGKTAPPLDRKVTSFEYQSVLEAAREAGFNGYSQERAAAKNVYTPEF